MKKSRKANSKPETSRKRRTAFAVRLEGNLLQPLLVSFDHLLDHLATHGAGFPGSQVAVVAVGQVDANLRWCTYYIVNSSDNSGSVGLMLLGSNSRMGSLTISPMNL